MPILKLSYSGHYPDSYVRVSDNELCRIKELEKKGYLNDTLDGTILLDMLEEREHVRVVDHTTIAYI